MAGVTLAQSTNVTSGAVGGGVMVLYAFACLQAGHFVTPSTEQALVLAGAATTFCHAASRLVVWMIEKHTGIDINNDGKTAAATNGAIP